MPEAIFPNHHTTERLHCHSNTACFTSVSHCVTLWGVGTKSSMNAWTRTLHMGTSEAKLKALGVWRKW